MYQLTRAKREAAKHYYWQRVRAQPTQPRASHWAGAVHHVHWLEQFRADMRASAKRSKAAKKAWKTRKARERGQA
jgi:hypothetical protein